jgi:acetylornithine deacetylase/succinyl-diaminopimelate desuccinylase-like protein
MKPLSATSLLKELVAIPSVNPDGDPGTPHVGEQAMAEHVGSILKKIGADVRLMPVLPGRPNVLGVFPAARKPKRRILLAPHLDTVSVAGMIIDPFKPVLKNGKLYGRGASDTKGPMASMLAALSSFYSSGAAKDLDTEVSFIGLMGEEAGQQGAKAWAEKGPRYDLVIAGEPTKNKIVHAHKGSAWIRLFTEGKACHASQPHRGKNAITAMAAALVQLQEKLPSAFTAIRHPALASPTFSVGLIQGGSKTNIVPDACSVTIDVRLVPPMTSAAVVKLFHAALKGHKVRIEVPKVAPPLDTDPDDEMIRRILPATAGLDVAPWFCDACVFAQKGMAAVALGPGSITEAHTNDEFIRVKDLEGGTAMFRRLLERLR